MNFHFFQLSEKSVEKKKLQRLFFVRIDNISQSVDILREKMKIYA